jgi:DNA replication protein DnaC
MAASLSSSAPRTRYSSDPGAWAKLTSRSLGNVATQKCYKTRFFSSADLVLMPEAAQRQGCRRDVMHRAISDYNLLIIDEISYLPMSRDQANLFFQIITHRNEHRAMILTSNLVGRSASKKPRSSADSR